MAKSIRSKVKKKHRSYMRKTIGEKVRTANIEAAATRGEQKKQGRANTKTLKFIKGALGAGQVDLGKAYYDAIVRPSKELVADAEDESSEDEDMSDEEEEAPAAPVNTATLEEQAVCQMSLRTSAEVAAAKVSLKGYKGGKVKGGGSGIFSRRMRNKAGVTSTRPAKEMVSF